MDDSTFRQRARRIAQVLARAAAAGVFATLATHAAAQLAAAPGVDCGRQELLQAEMAAAKQKGQMLRRQRIETQLEQLSAQCSPSRKPLPYLEQVRQQEKLVRELEMELEEARNALRSLNAARF